MVSIDNFLKVISPILVTILGFILNKFYTNKPKLIAYYGYVSSHKVRANQEGSPLLIHTHALVIRNVGRTAAHNLKVSYNKLPDYNIIPRVEHNIVEMVDHSQAIHFPCVAPKEEITITHLYYPPTTYDQIKTYIKCDEGLAQIISVMPAKVLTVWQTALIYTCLFFGASTILYFIMQIYRIIVLIF